MQQQMTLPFAVKSLLEELQDRHPFWHFDHSETHLWVEVETPDIPRHPKVAVIKQWLCGARFSESEITRFDHELVQAIQAQIAFVKSFRDPLN